MLALSRLTDPEQSYLDLEIARHERTVEHIERAISHGVSGATEAMIAERRRFAQAIEHQAMAAAPTRA